MKGLMRTIVCNCLAAILLCSCGCAAGTAVSTPEISSGSSENISLKYGENYRQELEKPEEGHLYGMCYIAYEGVGNGIDYRKAFELCHNLGVQSIRNWMHFSYYMSDYKTFIDDKVKLMHDIIAEGEKYGMFMIGMNHFNWSLKKGAFVKGKPKYQDWEGSDYYAWLECYEENWYTVVKEFPEITYWEIDNEINNLDFMYEEGSKEILPTATMAKIAADMMFYASRGIHRANSDAVTVMGGIVDPMGLGIGDRRGNGDTMLQFLELLYDEIDSGSHGSFHADDYFQVACWHPYYYRNQPDEYFVEQNNAIYEVIKRREGKDKKVYLTEFGWDERNYAMENIVTAIEKLFVTIKAEMPYVESLMYFRMFDNVIDNMNTAGLFYDPNPARKDVWGGVERTPGEGKPAAYAFQRACGGSGSLEILKTERNN